MPGYRCQWQPCSRKLHTGCSLRVSVNRMPINSNHQTRILVARALPISASDVNWRNTGGNRPQVPAAAARADDRADGCFRGRSNLDKYPRETDSPEALMTGLPVCSSVTIIPPPPPPRRGSPCTAVAVGQRRPIDKPVNRHSSLVHTAGLAAGGAQRQERLGPHLRTASGAASSRPCRARDRIPEPAGWRLMRRCPAAPEAW